MAIHEDPKPPEGAVTHWNSFTSGAFEHLTAQNVRVTIRTAPAPFFDEPKDDTGYEEEDGDDPVVM